MKNYKSKWKEPSPSSLDGCLATAGLISLETQVPSALCLGRDVPPSRGEGHRGSSSACPAPDGHAAATWEEQRHPDTVLLSRCLRLLPLACPGFPTDVVRMVTLGGPFPNPTPSGHAGGGPGQPRTEAQPLGVGTPVSLLPPPKEQSLLRAPDRRSVGSERVSIDPSGWD